MQQRLTDYRIAGTCPEVVIRPALPAGVATLTGFGMAADIIAAGEAAATAALPEIERWLRAPDAVPGIPTPE